MRADMDLRRDVVMAHILSRSTANPEMSDQPSAMVDFRNIVGFVSSLYDFGSELPSDGQRQFLRDDRHAHSAGRMKT